VRKLQKFQDAAEPACHPAQSVSSTTADVQSSSTDNRLVSEIGSDNPCSRHLSASLGFADMEWVISEWSRPYSRCDAINEFAQPRSAIWF